MAFDADRFTDALMLGTKMLIAKAVEPLKAENAALLARNVALEARLEAMEARDVVGELRPQVEALMRAVDALPGAPDLSGFATKDDVQAVRDAIPDAPDLSGFATKADVDALREEMPVIPAEPDLSGFATKADLAEVVLAFPEMPEFPEIPEIDLSGFATKADVDAVRETIPAAPDLTNFATKADLTEVVAAIPAPVEPDLSGLATKADLDAIEPVRHGKDADMDEVARLIGEAVTKAVAKLPPAKDGADADMAAILRHVDDVVAAAIPPKEELRGPAGRLPAVKAWDDGVHYEGSVVTHRGALYQAATDTGREPPHADWTCLAARGSDGRSVDVRGTYEDGAEYRSLDIVALNGGSFIALRDDPGPCPGDGWQLLAGRGKPGQSIKGDKGDSVKGDPGRDAEEVAGFYRDGDQIVLTFASGQEMRA